VNCCFVPEVMLAVAGEIEIAVKTGAAVVTVTVAVAVNPSANALMVVVPALTPVTSPVELTVATAVFEDDHTADVVTSAVEPLL